MKRVVVKLLADFCAGAGTYKLVVDTVCHDERADRLGLGLPSTGGSSNGLSPTSARLEPSLDHGNRIWRLAIGGGGCAFSWGPQDDPVSLATMRHALELGINWIDTAAVYGLGHSEQVVGRLLRERVERIDLYQFHWPDEIGTPVEDSCTEMVRLIEQRKVRSGGVSNFDVSLLERCEAIRHVDSLQSPFSLIRRQAAAREIPWCARQTLA